jgi:heme exporter protein C
LIFYPAILGWILMGWWIVSLQIRFKKIQEHLLETEDEKN